jgi:ribokinase
VEALCQWRSSSRATVVVTLGATGAAAVDEDGARLFGAPSVRAIDTVGAGDVFAAMLCIALATNLSLDDGVMLACAAGAIAVSDPDSLSLAQVLELAHTTYSTMTEEGGSP